MQVLQMLTDFLDLPSFIQFMTFSVISMLKAGCIFRSGNFELNVFLSCEKQTTVRSLALTNLNRAKLLHKYVDCVHIWSVFQNLHIIHCIIDFWAPNFPKIWHILWTYCWQRSPSSLFSDWMYAFLATCESLWEFYHLSVHPAHHPRMVSAFN
jgi:hypothetical protein